MPNCLICNKEITNKKRHEITLSHQNNLLKEEIENLKTKNDKKIDSLIFENNRMEGYIEQLENEKLENKNDTLLIEYLKSKNEKMFHDNQYIFKQLKSVIFENNVYKEDIKSITSEFKILKEEDQNFKTKIEENKKLLNNKTNLIAKFIIEEADFKNQIEAKNKEIKLLKIQIGDLKNPARNYLMIRNFEEMKNKLAKYVDISNNDKLQYFFNQDKNKETLSKIMGKNFSYQRYQDMRILRNQICHSIII